jgi:hypothetical protein
MKHIKKVKFASKVSKNSLIKNLSKRTSKTLTANGAVTFKKSGSRLLDFYAQAGSMRNDVQTALELFKKAFSEDPQSAVRILFYLRDVRGGQGERDLFRECLEWLGTEEEEVFEKIVKHVSEYGRWDDLFFDNDVCFEIIGKQLKKDRKEDHPSLLAKWMPTINASSENTRNKARLFAKALGFDEIEYRKLIRDIRKKIETVEELMSANKWKNIDYSAVPSQASRIYKNAFLEHDQLRYSKFIEKAEKGEVKINAGTLYPFQIYKSVMSDYSPTLEALWNQLPDYTGGKNAIVVADCSGSMMGDPMSVSVSLALYFAERNKGAFNNYFMTFSDECELQKVTGKTLKQKIANIEREGFCGSTNLQSAFDAILETAIENDVPEDEMPSTVYIISDMEFNSACSYGSTNLEVIQKKYKKAGYEMPSVVFWNVNASGRNLPAQSDEEGIAMVSGFSPVIFKMAVENKTPEEVMFDTINSERYAPIKI